MGLPQRHLARYVVKLIEGLDHLGDGEPDSSATISEADDQRLFAQISLHRRPAESHGDQ